MATVHNGSSVGHTARRRGVLMLEPFDEITGVPVSDPEGLIVSPFRDMPLACRIKRWAPGPSLGRTNTLQLVWQIGGIDVVADEVVFDEESFAAATFPYPLHVPTHFMLEFEAVISVRYRILEEGSPEVDSPARPLRLDRNPPRFLLPSDHPQFDDPNIVGSGITEAVLAANEFIDIRLPNFDIRANGDRVALYLSDETPPFPLIHTLIKTFVFTDEELIISVHRDYFRALPNGLAYMTARVYDRSGNYSPLSAPTGFNINLDASPSLLPPPEIRQPAYNDLLLKRDDARAGIAAVIPRQYDGFMPGDSVEFVWDGRSVLPAQVITSFPFPVIIPWSILRIPGPLTRKEVRVQYRIHRTGRPPFSSPVSFFWADFTIAGQDHSGAPALLNPSLVRVQVFGKSSGLLNELDLRDREFGASVWVRLYVDPRPGEVLALYWGSAGPVARYIVQAGDAFDDLVRFVPDVPGTLVVSEGDHPELPVFYTTSNGVNEQHAPTTLVNVHVSPGIDFSAPGIDHTLHGAARYLTCDSRPAICHGVRWKVADSRLQVGDKLEFYWQGFSSNNGSDPITGTEFEQTLIITREHLAEGVLIVVLPWDTKIAPMESYASATGKYYVYRGNSLIGESRLATVRIDRVSPGSGRICHPGDENFCDELDPRCPGMAAVTLNGEPASGVLAKEQDLAEILRTLRKATKKLMAYLKDNSR